MRLAIISQVPGDKNGSMAVQGLLFCTHQNKSMLLRLMPQTLQPLFKEWMPGNQLIVRPAINKYGQIPVPGSQLPAQKEVAYAHLRQ
jgi:hypothetical protein